MGSTFTSEDNREAGKHRASREREFHERLPLWARHDLSHPTLLNDDKQPETAFASGRGILVLLIAEECPKKRAAHE